jgi:ABC-type glucose/galactose transport system permease subunit
MKSAPSIDIGRPQQRTGSHFRNVGRWVRDTGPILALVLLVILGLLLNPSFLSWNNLSNVLTRSAFIGIISVGGTFVIVTGQLHFTAKLPVNGTYILDSPLVTPDNAAQYYFPDSPF